MNAPARQLQFHTPTVRGIQGTKAERRKGCWIALGQRQREPPLPPPASCFSRRGTEHKDTRSLGCSEALAEDPIFPAAGDPVGSAGPAQPQPCAVSTHRLQVPTGPLLAGPREAGLQHFSETPPGSRTWPTAACFLQEIKDFVPKERAGGNQDLQAKTWTDPGRAHGRAVRVGRAGKGEARSFAGSARPCDTRDHPVCHEHTALSLSTQPRRKARPLVLRLPRALQAPPGQGSRCCPTWLPHTRGSARRGQPRNNASW